MCSRLPPLLNMPVSVVLSYCLYLCLFVYVCIMVCLHFDACVCIIVYVLCVCLSNYHHILHCVGSIQCRTQCLGTARKYRPWPPHMAAVTTLQTPTFSSIWEKNNSYEWIHPYPWKVKCDFIWSICDHRSLRFVSVWHVWCGWIDFGSKCAGYVHLMEVEEAVLWL